MIHHDPGELVLKVNVFQVHRFVFACAGTTYGVGMDGNEMVTQCIRMKKVVASDLVFSRDVPLCIVCRSNTGSVEREVASEEQELGLQNLVFRLEARDHTLGGPVLRQQHRYRVERTIKNRIRHGGIS